MNESTVPFQYWYPHSALRKCPYCQKGTVRCSAERQVQLDYNSEKEDRRAGRQKWVKNIDTYLMYCNSCEKQYFWIISIVGIGRKVGNPLTEGRSLMFDGIDNKAVKYFGPFEVNHTIYDYEEATGLPSTKIERKEEKKSPI